MTLKDWLSKNRNPEYLGVNARDWLKRLGGRPLDLFNLAVNMRSPDIKHTVFKIILKESN